MQEVVAGAALEPSQGRGQIRSEDHHPEVVGPQQLVGERVIGGQVGDAALHQFAPDPDFVVEAHRIGGHRRIGDQPGLDVTPARAVRRGAADEAVHREPVQSFLHRPSLAQVSLRA